MPINSGDSPSDVHIFSGSFHLSGSSNMVQTITGGGINIGGGMMLSGNIYDSGGNEMLEMTTAGSAVNYLSFGNSATGGGGPGTVTVHARGDDSHVSLKLQAKGAQGVTQVGNSDGSSRGILLLNDNDAGGQAGFSAHPSGIDTSYYTILPANPPSGGSQGDTVARRQVMQVKSVVDAGGPQQVYSEWENLHGVYEPTGLKFNWVSLTAIALQPDPSSLDGVARIPVYSGSITQVAEVTGTLFFDFGLGPNAGAGGLQDGSEEAASAGYEIRYISGSGVEALLGTPVTGTLALPSGYTYASDILWFIYQGDGSIEDGGPAIMKFEDTGRTCWYGGFGPGSLHQPDPGSENAFTNADQNFLVNGAANDEWTEFSYDSQVPKNAKKVYLGFYYEGLGSSIWALSLSGTFGDEIGFGNLLMRMGSNDSNANASEAFWLTSTQPALTGTLMYRFQRYDGAQTGYMWCMGYSF